MAKYGKSRNPNGRPNFYRAYMEAFLATEPESFTVHTVMAWILEATDKDKTCSKTHAHRLINEQVRAGKVRVLKKYRQVLIHYDMQQPKPTEAAAEPYESQTSKPSP